MRLLAATLMSFSMVASAVAQDPQAISDQQYEASRSSSRGASGASPQPSDAQKLIGDVTPKLAELTDNVLFADVWERPGLFKRDRSLARADCPESTRAVALPPPQGDGHRRQKG